MVINGRMQLNKYGVPNIYNANGVVAGFMTRAIGDVFFFYDKNN